MIIPQKTTNGFSVSRLCDVPLFAPFLAAAHAREWGHLYANWNQDTALSDFQMEKGNTDLPTTWVIHHQSGALVGSVSLLMDDLPGHPDLNPWLASLFVFPEFRNLGMGRILVQKALDVLCYHQFPHAFLFTENKASFFSNFNFGIHGQTKAEGHEVTLMKWTNPKPINDKS
jgi:GNAT superfamily N-acetyltransferase